MDKLPNKKLLTVSSLCIGGALFVFFILLLSSKLPILSFDNHSQLAQIIAIETDLLKKWQQNASLKNNLAYNANGSDFPLLKNNVIGLTLSANSFVSISVPSNGKEKILIEKNKERQLPMASITKLMVALIASEQHKTDDVIPISENALTGKGVSGIYTAGDSFLFSDALYPLLLASHNEIASALAQQSGTANFVSAMNKKAVVLGMVDTVYVNPTGLDPVLGSEAINRSTTFDIYKLARYISENRPDIFSITSKTQYYLMDSEGHFIATIENTNKLVGQRDNPFRIIGSKTGETPRAKQNLVIVTESPCGGKIFSIVVGSQNSFEDMQNLLRYVNNSFQWTCSF